MAIRWQRYLEAVRLCHQMRGTSIPANPAERLQVILSKSIAEKLAEERAQELANLLQLLAALTPEIALAS